MPTSQRAGVRHTHPRLPATFGFLPEEGCFVNLAGDYSYLSAGYYASQERETSGECVRPTCREALDAYIVPLFLEKARVAGLPVPDYYLTNDFFDPPVLVDTVNPFMTRQSLVMKPSAQSRVAKSLTRNYTYAICCQKVTPTCRVAWLNVALGRTANPALRELAKAVWSVFHIPLARVRIVATNDGPPLLSALRPLAVADLRPREIEMLIEAVEWPI